MNHTIETSRSESATSGSQDWRAKLESLLDDYSRRPRPATSDARARAARAWQSELVDAGLAAPGWPTDVGGLGLELDDQLDYYRMISAANTPKHPAPISFIFAPTLIVYGTDEQKARYLEPLLRADELWCQGFSEPGAGSDLASLSTRAVRDGDIYRVTGQKIWTTKADRADWMFTLVRTGPSGRGTDGISYLLIKMDSPGVEVRPLRDAAGGRHFAEVFLDDVEVPCSNIIGEEGKGWAVMRTSLGHERATAFLADEFRYRGTVDKVFALAHAGGYGGDPLVRRELALVETGVRSIAANSARALSAVLRGEDPGGIASVNRLVKTEFEQQMHRLALRLTGRGAALGNREPTNVDGGRWSYGYLMTRASTIGAGTAEMQRNSIAEHVLGLPSHRGEGRRKPLVAAGRPLTPPHPDEAALRRVLSAAVGRATTTDNLLSWEARPADFHIGLWDELVEFGLPGLSVPEEDGGGGGSMRMLLAAIEEVGYCVAPVPLVPTVAALQVLHNVGAPVRQLCDGATAAFVVTSGEHGWVVDDVLPTVHMSSVTGAVGAVAGAPVADVLVVLARDAATGEPLLGTVLGADAVVDALQSIDSTSTIGNVRFEHAQFTEVARGHVVAEAIGRAERVAQLAVAADSVGIANRALALSVSWASEREQFGRPIGSYQAVSHRCADMLIAAEGARSQVLSAAEDDPNDPDTRVAVDLATAAALDAAVAVAEGCIQVHGGIGFTWEHPAHLLLRRAHFNRVVHAQPDVLRDRAARLVLERVQ